MITKFTSDEDEKLIDFVEMKPFLFVVTNPDYKNLQKKSAAWVVGNSAWKKW